MGKSLIYLILGFLLLLVIPGCAPREMVPAEPVAPAIKTPMATKAAWQKEWENTIAAAKKEKTVVVFAGISPDIRMAVIKDLKDKFSIEVEFFVGRGSELTRKIIMERKAGLYYADAGILGSGSSIMELKPQGDILEPFEPILIPQMVEPHKWRQGQLDWVDKDKMALAYASYVSSNIAINTENVKPSELKTLKDLLNPKWKGKIIIQDPTTPGAGNMWFAVIGGNVEGWDYMGQIVKQEPVIARDVRQMAEWVARGKHYIGIGITGSEVKALKDAGAPITEIAMGGYLSAGWHVLTVFKNRPHPNATRVFVNWLLSREGQLIYSKASGDPSVRTDIPTEFFGPINIPQSGINYFRAYSEEFTLKRAEYTPMAREIFAPLMK